jgi:hypothetical protein
MADSFTLRSTSLAFDALFFGTPRPTIRSLRGSLSPFAGWSAAGSTVEAASAVFVEQPAANAWAATAWSLRPATDSPRSASANAPVIHADNDRSWRASFPAGVASVVVERAGDTLVVVEDSADGTKRGTLALLAPSDTSDAYASIRRSHLSAVQKYPQFRDLYRYRLKLCWLLLVGFVVQELILIYFRVRHAGRRHAVIRSVTLCGWVVGGGLLTFYLPEIVDLYTRVSELYLR